MKICTECGGRTNNADEKGRCPFCTKIMRKKWIDCICSFNRGQHTAECSNNHRKNKVKQYVHDRIRIRKERQEKHLCASCGEKAERIRCPHCRKITGYMYRCKKCEDKIRAYNEKRKNEVPKLQ